LSLHVKSGESILVVTDTEKEKIGKAIFKKAIQDSFEANLIIIKTYGRAWQGTFFGNFKRGRKGSGFTNLSDNPAFDWQWINDAMGNLEAFKRLLNGER